MDTSNLKKSDSQQSNYREYFVSGLTNDKSSYEIVFAQDPHLACFIAAKHRGLNPVGFVEEPDQRTETTASISAYHKDQILASFFAKEQQE